MNSINAVLMLVKMRPTRPAALTLLMPLLLVAGCHGMANGDSAATLCIEDRDFPAVYASALQRAASDWNDAAGTELGVSFGACSETDIAVKQVESLPEADELAFSYSMADGQPNLIVIIPHIDSETARAALTHEIGHQLGLHHDLRHSDAIMAPYVGAASRITSADVEAYWNLRGSITQEATAPVAAP